MHYKAGLYHRDMKPENVTLDKNGDQVVQKQPARCKIIGFGTALRVPHVLDANGERVAARMIHRGGGTPGYKSPQARPGQVYDGSKNNVWSLGIIVVNMLMVPTLLQLRSCSPDTFNNHLIHFFSWIYKPGLSGDEAKKLICRLLTMDETTRPNVKETL